jgi:tetratricopeptide (TPR) repeat protein
VVARSSAASVAAAGDPLESAGRQLHVGSVVQGRVQRVGARVRILVQLVDVASRAALWSESYDRRADDILAVQQDVAGKVSDALHATLVGRPAAPGPPVRNAAAYDAYLRGLFFSARGQGDSAAAAFKLAVRRDSTFALAWGELAMVEQGRFFMNSADRQMEQAAYMAAERALALSPDLPQALVARASLLWTLPNGFQHQLVAQEFRRAIARNPNSVDAHAQLGTLFMHVGLLDGALAQYDTVLALDPTNDFVARRIARIHWYQGKYQQALDEWQNDDGFVEERAAVLAILGRTDSALALLAKPTTRDSSDRLAVRGAIFASLGHRADAERAIGDAIRLGQGGSHFHHASYQIAAAYAQLHDSATAVSWLDRTARGGMPCYPLFLHDPRLDPIRGYGPFVAFMAERKRQWEYFQRTL